MLLERALRWQIALSTFMVNDYADSLDNNWGLEIDLGRNMGKQGSGRGMQFVRFLCTFTAILSVTAAVGGCVYVVAPSVEAAPAADSPSFFVEVFSNLFNSRKLIEVLGRPDYTILAFVALNVIVFVETGLFFGFFLPGDSLLVAAGIVCMSSGWSLPLLLVTLCISAIAGDSVGYMIGWHTGPRIFQREKSLLFNKDHLFKAQNFYERHGGKTIILARFMPIIRTFAPVVAGVGKMHYRRFVAYNICGGIGWVVSMILFGFYLTTVVNVPLRSWFGPQFDIQDHIEKVIILVVLASISPGLVLWVRNKLGGKTPPLPPPARAQNSPELEPSLDRELAETGN